VRDFDGDGTQDLFIANQTSNDVYLLPGVGDGTFLDPYIYPLDPYPYSVAVGDFNADGILDTAVVVESTEVVQVFFGNGDGSFTYGDVLSVGNMPHFVVAGDFNGDGLPDLAVANAGSTTISLMLNATQPQRWHCATPHGSICAVAQDPSTP
jgi:hypothetical protein